MKSPRHKPRCASEAHLAADHALRKAIRAALRELYPDLPRPPGAGWLVALGAAQCPDCDDWLLMVKVPDVEHAALGYCLDCDQVFEVIEAETGSSPRLS